MDVSPFPGPARNPTRGLPRRGVVRGLAAVLGLEAARRPLLARAKRNRKKKRRCPKPDACPGRSCCVCQAPSPTPGCRVGPRSGDIAALEAVCTAACGGAGTFDFGFLTTADHTYVCSVDDSGPAFGCTQVRCPL